MKPAMRQARTLMVQGTGSGVGKSMLVAALCRIFKKKGWRVSPFKAQNMSNNSCVTAEGGEIARAQAMQAECAGVEPSIHMNPVLLKPHSNTGSQVVVHGKAIKPMQVEAYYRIRQVLMSKVEDSFRWLSRRFDLVIIEGAGSPAEINLRQFDFANMKMARMAKAPVILAGDIERCGVFAALYGTYALLTRAERRMVRGFVINKFRGNEHLLTPGIKYLEKKTGVPFLGTIPYLEGLFLDEEDSLDSFDPVRQGGVDVAVFRFPRISNFTDMKPLELEPNVRVRYFTGAEEFGSPDLVILPGTKSTVSDADFLKKRGIGPLLKRHAARGGAILGICGGFQMLGRIIKDSGGVESARKRVPGLGLLPVDTFFEAEKVARKIQTQIDIRVNGRPIRGKVSGYEIHMGRTPASRSLKGKGGIFQRGSVYGTYLHGLFDNDAFRRNFFAALAGKDKDGDQESTSFVRARRKSYARIAREVEKALDMKRIQSLLC